MLKFVNIKKKLIIQHTVTVHVRTYSIYNKKQTMKDEKLPAIRYRYITIQHNYGTEACYLQTVSDDEDSSLGQADVLRPKGSELDELGLTGSGQQLDCLIHSAALLGTQIFV